VWVAIDYLSIRPIAMRYRLRTLLIVLALGPPVLWFVWTKHEAWREDQARRAALLNEQLSAPKIYLPPGMTMKDITSSRPAPIAKRLPKSDE